MTRPSGSTAARRGVRAARQLPPAERAEWAEQLATRVDRPMSLLGVLFLLVVLGQELARRPPLQTVLAITAWVLWLVFVAEFALRLYVAPDKRRFLRRNWWQPLMLAVPFLRFLRLVALLRAARAGRVISAAVRSSRSAAQLASSRVGWLAAVTAVVALAASQLLYAFGAYDTYGAALRAAALATVTGEPLGRPHGWAQVIEIALAVYSVVVFATLAGTLGAYFLGDR